MLFFGLLFFAIIVIAGAVNSAKRQRELPPPSPEYRSPSELAADDQLEALRRYGTSDDAARLGEQGVDLGALGYRPRDE